MPRQAVLGLAGPTQEVNVIASVRGEVPRDVM